jgi:acyl carrier protein
MESLTLATISQVADACLGTDSGIDEHSADRTFDELDIDSLAKYELMTRLEESLHISISDDEMDGLPTPRSVLEFVNALLTGSGGAA